MRADDIATAVMALTGTHSPESAAYAWETADLRRIARARGRHTGAAKYTLEYEVLRDKLKAAGKVKGVDPIADLEAIFAYEDERDAVTEKYWAARR